MDNPVARSGEAHEVRIPSTPSVQSFPFAAVVHPMHEHRLSGWRTRQNEHRCSSSRKATHVQVNGAKSGSVFVFERTRREHEVCPSSSTKCAFAR